MKVNLNARNTQYNSLSLQIESFGNDTELLKSIDCPEKYIGTYHKVKKHETMLPWIKNQLNEVQDKKSVENLSEWNIKIFQHLKY